MMRLRFRIWFLGAIFRIAIFFDLKKILGFIQPQDNTFYSDTTHGPPDDDIPPRRSPTQAVISAFRMVFRVILWLPATGLFRDDNEIFINLP
jgi:hypothetical protein